jgi:iron complex outermembrane receptor protein
MDNVYEQKNCNRFNSGYKIIKQLKPSVGANNLLNVYPDKQDESEILKLVVT